MSRKKILTQSTMINYLNHKIEELDNRINNYHITQYNEWSKDTIEVEVYRKLIFDILKEKPAEFAETEIKNKVYGK